MLFEIGREYGYPECCIQSMADGNWWVLLPPEMKQKISASVFMHSGFIPCKCCIEKDHKEVLREIDSRRLKTIPKFLPDVDR